MGLAALQAALARLSTDPASRAEWHAEPAVFASKCALSEEEAAALAGDLGSDVEAFALSLRQKRMREAMHAMPLTAEVLGARGVSFFHAYTDATPLGAARNPALDALAFHRWLRKHATLPAAERDSLRYEAAWLTIRQTGRHWMIRCLVLPSSGRARRSLAVWWRWGDRVRHWVSA